MKGTIVVFAVALLGVTVIWSLGRISQNTSASSKNMPAEKPCAYVNVSEKNAGDPDVQAYLKRETNGFAEELSLAQAVRLFNEEQKCRQRPMEPLTEEEVLASILAGNDNGRESVVEQQQADLLKIAIQKRMPKGSLFVGEVDMTSNGKFVEGNIFIKGERIYLYLGLDKNARGANVLQDYQVYLVRKKFVSFLNK